LDNGWLWPQKSGRRHHRANGRIFLYAFDLIELNGDDSGSQWLHEIKHDGFRVIARKDGPRVRLYSRPGNDLTHRFPLIVETLACLRSCSCIIDGEAVACDDNGIASFDLIRDPLEVRKATLRSTLAKAGLGLRRIQCGLRNLGRALINAQIAPTPPPLSRFTAGAAAFFILSQSGERPER
jgi:ATP dependent DNA ligase-like protein